MKHAVIYVPGLGDRRLTAQQLAVNSWKLYGVNPLLQQMSWADGEKFEPKFNRLLERIDSLKVDGWTVSLVGASAGASAVLNAYAQRKEVVHGVVIICGKVRRPEAVSDSLYEKNPAFKQSMDQLDKSLKTLTIDNRSRILSIRPIADFTVRVDDTKIDNVREGLILTIGHVPSIAYSISLGAYKSLRFLKRLQAN